MNWREAIEQVLKDLGGPTHVSEIAAEAARRDLVQTFAANREANVSSAISKALREEGEACPLIQIKSGVYLWWDTATRERPGRNLSEVVQRVMRDAGESLHYNEIADRSAERLGLGGDHASDLRKVVNSLLSREPGFERVGVGEYVLKSPLSPPAMAGGTPRPDAVPDSSPSHGGARMSSQEPNAPEEIEGIGGDEDAGWGDYPIDTVLIRTDPRTVFEVVRRIEKGSFIMDPDFQRAFIWDLSKQSKLIESVLMRIPLPVFYLAEDDDGNMIVVDGLQRLSTFHRFLTSKLTLRLPSQPELNGKVFRDLSPKLQNRVEDCNLVLYIVDAKVPERARLDIFERVNSGVPLTRQQMRNCLYMGEATRFLREEADTELFKQATGRSLRSDTMRDREFVNRFCAFQLLDIATYSNQGEMDEFLASALRQMNHVPGSRLQALSAEFRNTLRNNFAVFGEHSFRKHGPHQERRSVLNASLWDVMSTGLSRIPESQVLARADVVRSRFYELMADKPFTDSITYGPNSANQVRHRFEVMRRTLSEVFDALDD